MRELLLLRQLRENEKHFKSFQKLGSDV